MAYNLERLAENLIRLSGFEFTHKGSSEIAREEWLNGKFFNIDYVISQLEKTMYVGLRTELKFTSIRKYNHKNLDKLGELFWRRFEESPDYVQMGIIVAGLRMELARDIHGMKAPKYIRAEHLFIGKAAAKLADIHAKTDYHSAFGIYLFSSKHFLRYIQNLQNAADLDQNIENINECIDLMIVSSAFRRDGYFLREAGRELTEKIARYNPKKQGYSQLIEKIAKFNG